MVNYRVVETREGMVGIVVTDRGLRRLVLPEKSAARCRAIIRDEFPTATENAELLPQLADQLLRYFSGEPVEFDVPLDWRGYHDFESDVWNACRRLGYGQTCSYGELAQRVGRPGGARAVGMAMSNNPIPLVVPCHRVLRSDGSLGGYSGTGGVAFKQRLLEMEAAATPALR
ncbi:Methylated-DNA--protein-cysteine methyltransferase [Phycisphaerae bacterium RAS1]|nr:Methylated-DNA--protein-cysteine methyltransferase [Phycisphaerae bacterium RAS1]